MIPEPRRLASRISVDGLCGVVAADELRHATMSDLSEMGVRLERPFDPKTARPVVQLEIELPGIDEVLWARAVVSFAILTPMAGRTADGQPRFMCKAGLRLANVAQREKKLLRDYMVEARRAQLAARAEPEKRLVRCADLLPLARRHRVAAAAVNRA